MIHKSQLVEHNLEILKNNIVLFYGENLGLITEFKKKIKDKNNEKIIRFSQNEILSYPEKLFIEIENTSLFDNKKIIFIQDANDKIANYIEEITSKINNNQIFIFSEILDKRSKLRNFCEKEKKIDVVPCYQDSEVTLRSLILRRLKNYKGLTQEVINQMIEISSSDRSKLINEISKIETYFSNKVIKLDKLNILLNLRENFNFNLIKDAALNGNKLRTNKLLNNSNFEVEKINLYISIINQRLNALAELVKNNDTNIENTISKLKPPIFWKDKPNFIVQSKLWNQKKLSLALKKIYNIEIKIKSNSYLDKNIVIKKMLVDICNIANAA